VSRAPHQNLVAGLAGALAAAALAANALARSISPASVLYHPRSLLLLAALPVCLALVALVPLVGSLPLDLAAAALAGGSLGNIASVLAWRDGVPDSIRLGNVAFNPADVLIAVGVAGLLLTAGLLAVRRRREPLHR
jgi:lipoprotein signal peptidase